MVRCMLDVPGVSEKYEAAPPPPGGSALPPPGGSGPPSLLDRPLPPGAPELPPLEPPAAGAAAWVGETDPGEISGIAVLDVIPGAETVVIS